MTSACLACSRAIMLSDWFMARVTPSSRVSEPRAALVSFSHCLERFAPRPE